MNQDAAELVTHCIRCGFCLESCPTFSETGQETESPRGRIYLVRSALEGKLTWEEAAPHLNRCLGCRACETACPSAVEYGAILELARDRLRQPLAKRIFLEATTRPSQLRMQLSLGRLVPGKRIPALLSRLLSGEAPEVDRPQPQTPGEFPPLEGVPPVRGHVYLLEGCAMRVLYPRVHACTRRLLRRIGYEVRDVSQGCCGALHAHNGFLQEALARAEALTRSMPDNLPVIVNSAGCGSSMKEYEDRAFAGRVFDASEFLAKHGLGDILAQSRGYAARVTYHDACHLAHGQRIRSEPRDLLRAIPRIDWVELTEADTCCGSAGIYNVVQPQMARRLLNRKWKHVEATRAQVVATGNPGCHAWIAQAAREHGQRVTVLHTLEALEAAFVGLEPFLAPMPARET